MWLRRILLISWIRRNVWNTWLLCAMPNGFRYVCMFSFPLTVLISYTVKWKTVKAAFSDYGRGECLDLFFDSLRDFTSHPSGSRAVPSESRWSTVNHVSRHMMSRCVKQNVGHFWLRRSRCVRRCPTLFVSCWGHMSGAVSRGWITCFCFQALAAATAHPGFSHDTSLSLSYVHKSAGETDREILFHQWFLVRGRCCQPTGCSHCGLCCCFVTSQVLHIALCCSSAVISVLVSVSSQLLSGVILFNQITLPWWDIFLVWQTVSLGKSPILPLSQQL